MNVLTQFKKLLKDGGKAFKTYPAVIGSAIAFALVTIIRIQLDWSQQEPYNFLFNCLHLAFAVGGIFSLALLTGEKAKYNTKKTFILSNIIGVIAIVITFMLLYFLAGVIPEGGRYERVSTIATARVTVAIILSIIAFIIIASYPREKSDIPKSFFMTEKAFTIALIYGWVIMIGTSGVAGAIQGLLYNDMSGKVYMYLGTISGFLAFTIFVGYFPDFSKDNTDDHREIAQKQPRFIEILLEYILVPIVLALTVVLILWAGKTVIQGIGDSFIILSGIATSYSLGGLWLHIMVSDYKSEIAKFYKKIYPISALIIIVFEAWALIDQLQKSGLKTEEYFFSILWIVALSSAILLIIKKTKAYKTILIIISVMAIISVMPIIGYYSLPVSMQINRLENILENQGMLINNEILPAEEEPDKDIKIAITDAVIFIAYSSENRDLPEWFNKELRNNIEFKDKMGFEQTWRNEDYYNPNKYMGTYLTLPSQAVKVQGYDWAINIGYSEGKANKFRGEKGEYEIYWNYNQMDTIPNLKILIDEETILEEDMNEYIDIISEKFPPGENVDYKPTVEDMIYIIDKKEIEVMLIFQDIEIRVDPQQDRINYWIGLDSIYLKEKP